MDWLTFLGDLKDHRSPPVGSPFQINFRNEVGPGFYPSRMGHITRDRALARLQRPRTVTGEDTKAKP